MTGLIKEIQLDCLNEDKKIQHILRKVKFAASSLKLKELESWVQDEISGYSNEKNIPLYRKSYGTPLAYHPYYEWVPIGGKIDPEFRKHLSQVFILQGVGSLQDLLDNPNDSGTYHLPIPQHIVDMANEYSNIQAPKMVTSIPRGTIVKIIETVRDRVSNWTIQMIEQGVIGANHSFNETEKAKAQPVMTNINTTINGNFSGQIGNHNTAGSISLSTENKQEIISNLLEMKKAAHMLVDDGGDPEIISAIEVATKEMNQQQPDIGVVEKSLNKAKEIATGAGGSMAGAAIIELGSQALNILGL